MGGRRTTRALVAAVALGGAAAAFVPAFGAPAAAQPTGCGLAFDDDGPVTGLIHLLVEPLVPLLADQVHGTSCTLASYGL